MDIPFHMSTCSSILTGIVDGFDSMQEMSSASETVDAVLTSIGLQMFLFHQTEFQTLVTQAIQSTAQELQKLPQQILDGSLPIIEKSIALLHCSSSFTETVNSVLELPKKSRETLDIDSARSFCAEIHLHFIEILQSFKSLSDLKSLTCLGIRNRFVNSLLHHSSCTSALFSEVSKVSEPSEMKVDFSHDNEALQQAVILSSTSFIEEFSSNSSAFKNNSIDSLQYVIWSIVLCRSLLSLGPGMHCKSTGAFVCFDMFVCVLFCILCYVYLSVSFAYDCTVSVNISKLFSHVHCESWYVSQTTLCKMFCDSVSKWSWFHRFLFRPSVRCKYCCTCSYCKRTFMYFPKLHVL
jgi:hypothetical protein